MKKLYSLIALMTVMCVTAMAGTWSTSKDYYLDPSACSWFTDANPDVYITYDSQKIKAEKQNDGTFKFRLTSVPTSTINFRRTNPGDSGQYWNSINNVAAPDNDTYTLYKTNNGFNGGSWSVYTATVVTGVWSTDKDYYVNVNACSWFTNGGAVLRVNDGKTVVNTELVAPGIYKFRLTNPGKDGYITLLRQDPGNPDLTESWNSASIAAPDDAANDMMISGTAFDASNAYTWGVYDSAAPKYPETLYVMGNINGASWSASNGLAMTASEDGLYSLSNVSLAGENGGANAYFSFASHLGANSTDWDSLAPRYGATSGDLAASLTEANTIQGGENAFVVPNGKYDMTVSLVDMTMTIKAVEVAPTYPETLYIIGNVNGGGFAPDNGVELTAGSETGKFSIDKVAINTAFDNEYGYFSFADALGPNGNDESYSYMKYRYGATENNMIPTFEGTNSILRGENAFMILPGDYKISIDLIAGEMTISIVEPVVEPGEAISLDELCYVVPADEEEIKETEYWHNQVMIGMQLIGNWSINTTPATATLSKDGTVILSLENTNSEQCQFVDYGVMADADLTGNKMLALVFDTENGISADGLYTMTIPEGFLINNGHPNAEYTYSWQIGKPTPSEITLPETLYMLIGVGEDWNISDPVAMTKQAATVTFDDNEYTDYYANVDLKAEDLFSFSIGKGSNWDADINSANRWGAPAYGDVTISTTEKNRTKNALTLYQVGVNASACEAYKVPAGTEAGKYLVHVYLNKNNATPYVTLFKDGSTVSVEGIEADGEAAYYTLEGLKVAEPVDGLYIKVVNGKATKVLIRK